MEIPVFGIFLRGRVGFLLCNAASAEMHLLSPGKWRHHPFLLKTFFRIFNKRKSVTHSDKVGSFKVDNTLKKDSKVIGLEGNIKTPKT